MTDRIITSGFPGTVSRGFAGTKDPGDRATAVCLRPGTEISFERNPVYVEPTTQKKMTAPSSVARFRQVEMDNQMTYHDALDFGDGVIVKLAMLESGQVATVLQLPSVPLHEKAAGHGTVDVHATALRADHDRQRARATVRA